MSRNAPRSVGCVRRATAPSRPSARRLASSSARPQPKAPQRDRHRRGDADAEAGQRHGIGADACAAPARARAVSSSGLRAAMATRSSIVKSNHLRAGGHVGRVMRHQQRRNLRAPPACANVNRRICCRSAASSLEKGSSSSNACGCASSARSSDTRERWPPDRLAGKRAPKPPSPGLFERRSAACTRVARSPAGSANKQVVAHRHVREQQIVLKQQADAALLDRQGSRGRGRPAASRHWPRTARSSVPAIQASSVDLPVAAGAHHRQHLARLDAGTEIANQHAPVHADRDLVQFQRHLSVPRNAGVVDPRRMTRSAAQSAGRDQVAEQGGCLFLPDKDAGKGAPGQAGSASLRRSPLALRLPCGARSRGPSQNSLRSLRSLRSNRRATSQSTKRAARAGHEPCAPQRRRGALRPARTRLCGNVGGLRRKATPDASCSRRAVAGRGDFWGGEEHRSRVGARSALRRLTRGRCLNAASAASVVSSCGATLDRAPQRSRSDSADRPSMSPCRLAACRDRRANASTGSPRQRFTWPTGRSGQIVDDSSSFGQRAGTWR